MGKYLRFSVKKEQRLEEKTYKGSFFFGLEDDDRLEIVRKRERSKITICLFRLVNTLGL